jgi:ubiquinone/menaquinone biosynthesis C-methylase UbiE
MEKTTQTFVPAAGHDIFLPFYDALTSALGFAKIRRALVARADLQSGERLLDVGCGTGTLILAFKRRHPNVDVVGLDPDAKALARAARKLNRGGVVARLEKGYANALPFDDRWFDRVVSSFMFHHLDAAQKEAMVSEVHRVLKPGGRLDLMDFAGEREQERRGLGRWFYSHEVLAGNAESNVTSLLARAGFGDVRVIGRDSSLFGPVIHYRATRAQP